MFLTCGITIQMKPLLQCLYLVLFVFHFRKRKFGRFVNFDFGLSRVFTRIIRGSLLAYSNCMNTYRTLFFFFLLFVGHDLQFKLQLTTALNNCGIFISTDLHLWILSLRHALQRDLTSLRHRKETRR